MENISLIVSEGETITLTVVEDEIIQLQVSEDETINLHVDGDFSRWTSLIDTEDSFEGFAGYIPRVNIGEDALEFYDIASDLDLKLDISDFILHTTNISNPHSVSLEQARSVNNQVSGDIDMNQNHIDSVEYLNFDTSYISQGLEPFGTTYWDEDNETISTVLKNGVVGQHFEEAFITGQNDTGSTIINGTVATYAGSIGNSGNIRVNNTVAAAGEIAILTLGVITQDIADGGRGKITTRGNVRGIQTDGANYSETWVEGEILYKSSTISGGLTNVSPQAPIPAIPLAVVISVHATNGTILVRPTFPQSLTILSDVNGTPVNTTGQMLVWNQAQGYFDFDFNINDYLPLVGGIMSGDINMQSDSIKITFGAGNDMSIIYDGTDGNIKTDEVAPSDLLVHCGLNKTLELQHAVTDDMQIDVGAVKLPPANAASIVLNPADSIGLAVQFETSKDQSIHFNMQSPHARVDESDIDLHMHVTPGPSINTGNVYMELKYDWKNIDGTYGGTTTVNATFAMDGTAHKHQYENMFEISGTGKSSISSIICCKLTRLGTNVLDTFTGDLYAVGIDFHVLKNTLGSRQEIVK